MEKRITDSSVGLTRKNRRKQIWYKVVSSMACVVVFCTVYALILPAITLTEDYYCGLQEHIHTEECYRRGPEKTSICTAQPHVHQAGCYDADGKLQCGMADFFLHTHSEICYDRNGLLVCQLDERQLHTHSEGCYLGETVYSCGKTEGEAHVHGDGCFSMESSLICGQPEQEAHHHDESCYCQENVLVCALQEQEGHQHTDGCYGTDVMLVCEQEGLEDHIHTEECYQTTPKLLCEMEECEAHFHGEGCYASQTVEVCGLEETEGHTHEESCYGETAVLCCSIPEGEVHHHDEACQLLSEPVLVCDQWELILEGQTSEPGKLSVTEHIHTESCFQTEDAQAPELICGLEEHTHRLACTSDRSANRETAEIWRTTLPEKLTGDPAADLLAVAESQFGYQESARNFEVTENDKRKGYTRYGQWYGDPYGDWCAMYVSFCLHYAGIPEEVVPYHSNCPNWLRSMEELGLYRSAAEHIPVPGDIVFFGESKEIVPHVGIVKEVTEEQIITIEGNTSNRVDSNNYLRTAEDSPILGYGSIEAIRQRGITLGLMAPPEVQEPVQPVETEPVQPEETEPVQPEGTEPVQPEETEPVQPEETEPVQPEETEPVQMQQESPAKTIELEADYGEIHIRLIAPCDAFPVTAENLSLMVTQPSEAIREELSQRMGEGKEYLAVDIEILCDGVPIQPNGDVQVIFEPKNTLFPDADGVDIYHAVEGEENEILDMRQVEGGYNEDGNIFMEADHFSTYVVTAAESEPGISLMAETPTNTWQEALTDRSGNIGVASEGYADSPYTKTREFASENITAVGGDGGTAYLGKNIWGVYHTDPYYAERYWDGGAPVRITSTYPDRRATLTKTIYADWFLEDNKAPNAPLKIDNVHLETNFAGWNLYGRGNKIVIGENVTTEDGEDFRIYGGSDTNNSTTTCPTNVVIESGNWHLVCGGGHGDIPNGTTVTVRGNANISTLYGGGTERSTVGTPDGQNTDVNIYVEGGNIGALYGGNRVEKEGCAVYEDINIEVTGGHVGILCAGNDYTHVDNPEEWEESFVQGNVTVSIKNGGSATQVIGDPYHTPYTRSIKGSTILECYVDEKFNMLDQWDVVRIVGDGTPNSTTVETLDTTGGKYIGRIEVNNGGRLYLDMNGYINILNEKDQTLTPLNAGSTPYELKHAWAGEASEARRNLSTLAVLGNESITPSGGYLFDPDEGKAGLRIKGNVEGFSTLEACGEPMYSTGDTYYYYVVADSSDNGGKAFREPDGAPYVVCYRYLQDGRIGWYLRERPVLKLGNKLLRVGTSGTLEPNDAGVYGGAPENYMVLNYMVLEVDMKGFAYEWSNTPGKNRVELAWTIYDGYENAEMITKTVTVDTMADIYNNIYSTGNTDGIFANVSANAQGTDEGSTESTPRVTNFFVILDTSTVVDPRYYEVAMNFQYNRGPDAEGEGGYEDERWGQSVTGVRCSYDFDNDDTAGEPYYNQGLPTDGEADSIMTTYDYVNQVPPKGADDALLRVYLPEGVTADTFTVSEDNGSFVFKSSGKVGTLVTNSEVQSNYSSEDEATYNHEFGVTLQKAGDSEIDLANGATMTGLTGKTIYHCAVYSHANISYTDITHDNEQGLKLNLRLTGLKKDGVGVGTNPTGLDTTNPSTTNNGELRIQVLPVGTIIETTTVFVEKVVVDAPDGCTSEFEFLLSYPKIDENGNHVTHEERFSLKHGETQAIVVPLETEITVKEIGHDGYHVEVGEKEKNRTTSDTIVLTTPDKAHLTDEKQHIIFYNTPGAEMPSTGGLSATNYTFLGLLLMMGALLLWMHRRERGAAY